MCADSDSKTRVALWPRRKGTHCLCLPSPCAPKAAEPPAGREACQHTHSARWCVFPPGQHRGRSSLWGLSLSFQRHTTALLPLRHTGGALTTTGGHAHVHASAAAQLPSRLSAGQGAAGVLVATQLARLSATHTAPLSAALAAPHALRAVRLASNAAGGGRQNRSGGSEDAAVTAAEDPFSSLTDKCVLSLARRARTGTSSAPGLTHHLHTLPALTRIPAKPVTRTETVSYGVVILAGLGVALAAAWAVLKGVSRSHRMAVRTAPGDVHMTLFSPSPSCRARVRAQRVHRLRTRIGPMPDA